jgi:hypothetical protein
VTRSARQGAKWQLVGFAGPNGGESVGIVDLLAIRKDHRPKSSRHNRGDCFDIVLIQFKGGSTKALPSRCWGVGANHRECGLWVATLPSSLAGLRAAPHCPRPVKVGGPMPQNLCPRPPASNAEWTQLSPVSENSFPVYPPHRDFGPRICRGDDRGSFVVRVELPQVERYAAGQGRALGSRVWACRRA